MSNDLVIQKPVNCSTLQKNALLKISQNSKENTSTLVSLLINLLTKSIFIQTKLALCYAIALQERS